MKDTTMENDQSARPARGKPFYTLFIGNTGDRPFSFEQRAEIIRMVSGHFPSFTVLDAQGFYNGKPLPTLQVQIATKDPYALSVLCQAVGLSLKQKFIGLCDGQTYRAVAVVEPDQDVNSVDVSGDKQTKRVRN